MRKRWTLSLKYLFGAVICVSMYSCTTMIHVHGSKVNLFTEQPDVKVYFDDSTQFAYTPVELSVPKSKKPLVVHLKSDTIERELSIPAKIDGWFYFGNILNGTAGLGMLIDLTNERKFKYPENVLVDLDDENRTRFKLKYEYVPQNTLKHPSYTTLRERFPRKRGEMKLSFSIPEGNNILLHKQETVAGSNGFLGITGGVDYYYKDKNFYGLSVGNVIDFSEPIPFETKYDGNQVRSAGNYLSLVKGFDMRRLSVGYGISLVQYRWYRSRKVESSGESYIEEFRTRDTKMGAALQASYNFSEWLAIGGKYLPSFYSIKNHNFEYGHLLFLELIFNIRINADKSMKKFKLENK